MVCLSLDTITLDGFMNEHLIVKHFGDSLEITQIEWKKSSSKRLYKSISTKDKKSGRYHSSLSRTRSRIREHVFCNFPAGQSIFLTLTFRDHVISREVALSSFDLFRRKLKKDFPDIKYLSVAELTKKGRIHFHLLLDRPFISHAFLSRIWGQGFVFVLPTKGNTRKLASYISKYISKDLFVSFGKKAYLISSNLEKPIIVRGLFEASNYIKAFLSSVSVRGGWVLLDDTFSGENEFMTFSRRSLDFAFGS